MGLGTRAQRQKAGLVGHQWEVTLPGKKPGLQLMPLPPLGDLRGSLLPPQCFSFPTYKAEVKPGLPVQGCCEAPLGVGAWLAGRAGVSFFGRGAPVNQLCCAQTLRDPSHITAGRSVLNSRTNRETNVLPAGPSDSVGAGNLAATTEPD